MKTRTSTTLPPPPAHQHYHHKSRQLSDCLLSPTVSICNLWLHTVVYDMVDHPVLSCTTYIYMYINTWVRARLCLCERVFSYVGTFFLSVVAGKNVEIDSTSNMCTQTENNNPSLSCYSLLSSLSNLRRIWILRITRSPVELVYQSISRNVIRSINVDDENKSTDSNYWSGKHFPTFRCMIWRLSIW